MAPPPAVQATPPRPATSRLLSMKFMNRLGPSDAALTPSSPLASGPQTPASRSTDIGLSDNDIDDNNSPKIASQKRRHDTDANTSDDQRSLSKRRRLSAMGDAEIHASTSMADLEASMRAAVDEEERRRQAAVKKRAAELGDEHWTWDRPLPPHVAKTLATARAARGLEKGGAAVTDAQADALMVTAARTVVRVGFAEIDSSCGSNVTSSSDIATGRDRSLTKLIDVMKPRIMRFNMKKSSQPAANDESESDDGGSTNTGRGKGGKHKGAESHKNNRKKEAASLKNLTSLSSQGGQNTMKCHRCGRSGHKAMECPSAQRRPGSKKR